MSGFENENLSDAELDEIAGGRHLERSERIRGGFYVHAVHAQPGFLPVAGERIQPILPE
jgi:hypothetical protein